LILSHLRNDNNHKTYVSTLYKDYFIRNIEKKNNRDWLKNKRSTYKTPFLTPFGSLVCFVYFRSTGKNIHILLDHQMNIHSKFGSNWPMVSEKKIKNWRHHFWHIWASWLFCVLLIKAFFRGSSNEHSYQVWFQLVLWFQRRGLKCESTQTTTTMTTTTDVDVRHLMAIPHMTISVGWWAKQEFTVISWFFAARNSFLCYTLLSICLDIHGY
jgi:hypothetical protein